MEEVIKSRGVMVKGRLSKPDGTKDGNWFSHLGLPVSYSAPPRRTQDTSTGIMLSAPYKPDSSSCPFPPPRGYLLRDSRNFKLANDFSQHNNRHLLQNTGEYFGGGADSRSLGRRLAAPHLRHHTTPGTFLHDDSHSWHSLDGTSIYTGSYHFSPKLRPLEFRRFPRTYPSPRPDTVTSTNTTDWHRPPLVPYQPPLQVLASSQEPFLKPSLWKYSYHGESKCYPPHTSNGSVTGRHSRLLATRA